MKKYLLPIFFLLLYLPNSHAAKYIELIEKNGRQLFHSDSFGSFWSIGINAFMSPWDNTPLNNVFQQSDFKVLFEQEFARIKRLNFNPIGGWSDLSQLKGRIPFGVMLFDDKKYPRNYPLLNSKQKAIQSKGQKNINPIGDPYNPQYQKDLEVYIKSMVSPFVKNKALGRWGIWIRRL